ncbi:MAG: TonB-dependent receptor plug, partial [Daejeonella sp.]|nr:TonB-dependent receptor plug [Daejeonella sp.]
MESYVFAHPYINLLIMRKILFTLPTLLLLLVYGFSVENSRTISGIVNDENGSPLPGASVHLKGTKNNAVTDVKGFYKVDVPSGRGTLIFSFLGYQTQEVKIGKDDKMNIS